jgi:hypothetical protein
MNWWNLGGLNPKFKDFMEKHPDKTLVGIGWAFYWRFMVVALIFEIILMVAFVIFSMVFSGFNH